jgi:hypothetical protein
MTKNFVLMVTERIWYDMLRKCIEMYGGVPTIYNRAEFVLKYNGIYNDDAGEWGAIIFESEEAANWFLLHL